AGPRMPRAMSRLSEPVGTVSMSIALECLPSRMIEPLPNARSICDSAASSAFDLSMEAPSTTRSAGWAIDTLLMTMILRVDNAGRRAVPLEENHRTLFVLRSQYVLRELFRRTLAETLRRGRFSLSKSARYNLFTIQTSQVIVRMGL